MVKVGIDRAHRLTPSLSSPSKRHISSIMVLYTHDSRFLQNPTSSKKVTPADLEPLASRTGFHVRELMKFLKNFQKLVNPKSKGVDQQGFTDFMAKTVNIDPTDEKLCQRLFEVQNSRGAAYLVFDQVVELVHMLKKGTMMTIAELFYRIIDTKGNGWVALSEIEEIFEPPERREGAQLDIVKERRKITMIRIMASIYEILDKKKDARISQEEFINAVCLHPDVAKYFDRIGFLILNSQGPMQRR